MACVLLIYCELPVWAIMVTSSVSLQSKKNYRTNFTRTLWELSRVVNEKPSFIPTRTVRLKSTLAAFPLSRVYHLGFWLPGSKLICIMENSHLLSCDLVPMPLWFLQSPTWLLWSFAGLVFFVLSTSKSLSISNPPPQASTSLESKHPWRLPGAHTHTSSMWHCVFPFPEPALYLACLSSVS